MGGHRSGSGNAILQYSFLHVFANDSTIDAGELAMIERLAMKDGVVDDQERKVIGRIFARVSEETVSKEVWGEICRFKAAYQIG
jgi:hypothetical protein